MHGEPVRFEAAPIWHELYYPILASLIASVGVYLIDLVRPWRTLTVSAVDSSINLANIAIVTWCSRGPLRRRVDRPTDSSRTWRGSTTG